MNPTPTVCPSCSQPLEVTELTCAACDLRIGGHFQRGCRFCSLDPEHRRLLDVFLSSRGVLRDMEAALGLSYPTVRSRVDALLVALGYAPTTAEAEAQETLATRRHDILDRLQAGNLTPEQAADALAQLSGGQPRR
jgi:hypothetical protein